MTIEQYIERTNKRLQLGNDSEHTYRGDLEQLIENLVKEVHVTNEPRRRKCGAPDYVLTKKGIEIGYIEAKKIGASDLEGKKENKEQFDRYKRGLPNLIFTDYLDFHLYREGIFITKIAIAEVRDGKVIGLPENFVSFSNLIKDFASHIGQTIKSSKRLAEMMAGKARLLSDVIEKALVSDEETNANSTLKDQMNAFKQILIHDITPKAFADVYAQTIAYGMFAARLHDPSLASFSRQEAAELIPKSNPFLRKLFSYIAGPDIDDRIKWIVDGLVDIFLACNVAELLKNYGKSTKTEDPIIHFYETFLSEYDPKLRKARGVWYTPAPVVNFIVRAVDDILKTEFGLPQGLADTSKTKIKTIQQSKATSDARSKIKEVEVEEEVHRVQILDPATGTGTFLAEVVKHIHQKFEGQQGIWSNYVEKHLLPRLNGFELLMASYAMAHLQLDLLLTDTGYKPTIDQRLRVFLTNSLEESHPDTGTLFANWLSSEANEANRIKRDTPVMCVIGNPPYAVSSTNKGEWIQNLIADYKKNLNERKINLDDDYIKFIRYGQHFIDKNGSGILAFITANSFIDGITHRQMRKHLLESFDKIYILDLHGNAKKKEVCTDGSADQNVFDIMQGVSINIFIKTGKKKDEFAELLHCDIQGKRDVKYAFLNNNQLKSIPFKKLIPESNHYFFVPKNFTEFANYNLGFSLSELFFNINNGFQTDRDSLFIDIDKLVLGNRIEKLFSKNYDSNFIQFYNVNDSSSYKLIAAIEKNIYNSDNIQTALYRPFDIRYIYFDAKVISRPAQKVLSHFNSSNLGLIISKQQSTFDFQHVLVTDIITERCSISLQTKETGYVFPLYLYPEISSQQTIDGNPVRTPNLNMEIVQKIGDSIGLYFEAEEPAADDVTTVETNQFYPINILDYIYAVLHSPSYREKYKEFLKIDFPRVPYPKDIGSFWKLVELGSQIRKIHLLESPVVDKYITQYPVDGDNLVGKIKYDAGKVFINDTQYFDNVPEVAWNFYIGGYQPAQKWLKDRKERTLEFDDILHYQKIIVALKETDRLMKEIDKIEL